MVNTKITKILFLLPMLMFIGCTEQYILQTETFEDAIVVEATLTNELKIQEIKLSRTYKLEAMSETSESGAQVYVTDSDGNQYDFLENDGLYQSETPFKAEVGKRYRLNIITQNGKTYQSESEVLTTENPMQEVLPTVMQRNGERGVGIVVKSYDPNNTSKYYRYEYVETFKVIAPQWDDERTILTQNDSGTGILVIPRTQETQTCYSTENSNDIIQTSTNDLSEDRVNFAMRFISNQNYIISHRYSILVRQYVQSLAAFTFYKTLKETSGSGSILSQNQPGFFYGNMKSIDNPNEKVIGFFEVASVSEQRVFFNYTDLFPGEPLPPYFTKCDIREYKYCFDFEDPDCRGAALLSSIGSNSLVYVDSSGNETYFFMVVPPCGDCTTFSSNIIPSFWID
jgi:hypothetical protein